MKISCTRKYANPYIVIPKPIHNATLSHPAFHPKKINTIPGIAKSKKKKSFFSKNPAFSCVW
jgi:hypothetical protein